MLEIFFTFIVVVCSIHLLSDYCVRIFHFLKTKIARKMVVPEFSKNISTGDFSDPLFKKLSLVNGEINKLDVEKLSEVLQNFSLNDTGCKEVKQKRLKSFVKNRSVVDKMLYTTMCRFDYFCIIDFEATCVENNRNGYYHEIIEFPIILLNVHTREIEDTFHSYVRPVCNPRLSHFCKELTGITQSKINHAPYFTEVLKRAEKWLDRHGLFNDDINFAIVTDGPFDISKFLVMQCNMSEVPLPKYAERWINIRKIFCNFYKIKCYPKLPSLEIMLEQLGLKFDGRPHCGLDDAKNIARIVITLLGDGCVPDLNEDVVRYGYTWMVSSSLRSSKIDI